MPNGKSHVSDLEPNIPTYLPLSDAAKKYDLSEQVLTQLIQAGKIEAVQLPSGELLVAADNGAPPKTKEKIIEDKFVDLRGQRITVTDAAEKYGDKYGFHRNTILEWVKRKYITVIKPGYRMELDEADVAYCAYIYDKRRQQGVAAGARIFDEDGNPYKLKHPDLARKRRQQKNKN